MRVNNPTAQGEEEIVKNVGFLCDDKARSFTSKCHPASNHLHGPEKVTWLSLASVSHI